MTDPNTVNTRLTADNPRGGINVHFELHAETAAQVSPSWTIAGRELQFIRLAAGQSWELEPGDHFAKVILGDLANIHRSCLTAPFTVRSTGISESVLVAGEAGALFALMTMPPSTTHLVTDLSALEFTGPLNEHLTWQRFDEKFAGITDFFDGKNCHMANGFHLIDENGDEIVYVNPWACGKGVDLSTHNHGHPPSPSNPAFTEVHWVLAASTDNSGMYQTPTPDSDERVAYVMGFGDEHGPFYDRDAAGYPLKRQNGAVQYPWHGWQGGTDDSSSEAYDVVAAFESNPDFIEARPEPRGS